MSKIHVYRFKIWIAQMVLTLLYLPYSIAAYSQLEQAFFVINENPFIRIFGQAKPESANVLSPKQFNFRFAYYVSNNSIHEQSSNEEIFWDGETSIYETGIRYGLKSNLTLGMDIPYVKHSGGVLDSAIRRTHKIMGLSNTRQQQFDKNQLAYVYSNNGISQYKLNRSTQGLGDIRLITNWQLERFLDSGRHDLSIYTILKFPTGKSSTLLGSGGTDISLAFSYHNPDYLSEYNINILANLGMLRLGKSDVFRSIQREYANFSNFTLIWHFSERIKLKTQLDYHSPFYNSHLLQLGSSSIKLDLGANIVLSGKHHIEVGMMQNLRTDTTADFGVFLYYQIIK